ncbi:MAG: glutathione S-transferase family protein [Aliidongia sp.]
MLKIYGPAWSRANRVLWLAAELGLEFEHVPTDLWGGAHKQPEFLALNPNGRVPVLVDGDLVLSESLAINLYLAKQRRSSLYPQDAASEARIWQWTIWAASDIEMPLITALVHRVIRDEPERDHVAADTAEERLQRGFKVLELIFAERPYLLGDGFTLADLNLAGVLLYAEPARIGFARYPHLADWRRRCVGRPGYAAFEVAAGPAGLIPPWAAAL